MCLLALALDDSRRFPLVLAANRDEFFARPASRLAWWSPGGAGARHPFGARPQRWWHLAGPDRRGPSGHADQCAAPLPC